jgi:hypothetical protein
LGINVQIVIASSFNFQGRKSNLVLDMCKKLGATDYIFGVQGKNYADAQNFLDHNINLTFQNYVHPVYPQLHGDFEPYMSFIDLLFNVGPKALEVIMRDNINSLSDKFI